MDNATKFYDLHMRVYGVYTCSAYPEWMILVTDFASDDMALHGLAFDMTGKLCAGVSIYISNLGTVTEVGYVYGSQNYSLQLRPTCE